MPGNAWSPEPALHEFHDIKARPAGFVFAQAIHVWYRHIGTCKSVHDSKFRSTAWAEEATAAGPGLARMT